MSGALFGRGRAERFAQLLDEAAGGPRHHVRSQADGELKELRSVSQRVSDLPLRVEAEPEFRDGLRAMLMATIEREGIGATATNPEADPSARRGLRALRRPGGNRAGYPRRSRARGAIVIGLAAGTLAVSGISAASGDAIPGDTLYPMKRSTEKAQLALAGSDISRGQLYLGFARTRLAEAQSVRNEPAALTALLDDLDAETRNGVKLLTSTAFERRDKAALDAIDAFAIEQRQGLIKLRDSVPGAAGTRAEASVVLLTEVLRRSTALRPLVACGSAATATADLLGPTPRTQYQCRQPYGQQRPNAPTGNTPATKTDKPAVSGTSTAPIEATSPSTSTAPVEPTEPERPSDSDDSGGLIGGLLDGLGG